MPRISTIICICTAALITGCNGSDDDDVSPAVVCDGKFGVVSISIDPPEWETSTRIGQIQQLSVTASADAHVLEEPCNTIVWESGNPLIASVDSIGLVRARTRGVVTITARDVELGQSDTLDLIIESGVPSEQPVNMYTTWPARRVQHTVVQVGDRIVTARNRLLDDWCCTYPSPWTQGGIAKYQWYNDRIGILSDLVGGAGTFRIVERAREWKVLATGNAVDFQIFRRKIILLDDEGYLRIKLDGIDDPWIQVAGPGIKQFRAHMDWPDEVLTVVRDDGLMLTKVMEQDSVNAPWIHRDAVVPIERFKVFDRYIAVMREDGAFGVFDLLDQSWHLLESSGVRNFALSNTGIFMLLESGLLQARAGIRAAWKPLATDVESFRVNGQLIAAQHESGHFRVKETLDGPWRVLSTEHVLGYALQEGYIGFVPADRKLRVVNGINGTIVPSADSDELEKNTARMPEGELGHITLIADVREPPTRTISTVYPNGSRGSSPASLGLSGYLRSYPDDQLQCMLDNTVPWDDPRTEEVESSTHNCRWVSESPAFCLFEDGFGAPNIVPCYGRFCGGAVPNSADWDWANYVGSIDSFDQLCLHHDKASIYYKNVGDGAFDACIVDYGLEYGRLTYDGEHIVEGDPRWSGMWATMWNISDAIDNYETLTSGCLLSRFIDDTTSPRTQDPPD